MRWEISARRSAAAAPLRQTWYQKAIAVVERAGQRLELEVTFGVARRMR